MAAVSAFKRPESVLVIVHTQDAQVLLLERRQPVGFWQSITGSLQWGESAPVAARRELEEETGLVSDRIRDGFCQRWFDIPPAWRAPYAPGVTRNLEHMFSLCLPAARPIRLSPTEHRRYRWLDKGAALEQVSSWTNLSAIESCVASMGDA